MSEERRLFYRTIVGDTFNFCIASRVAPVATNMPLLWSFRNLFCRAHCYKNKQSYPVRKTGERKSIFFESSFFGKVKFQYYFSERRKALPVRLLRTVRRMFNLAPQRLCGKKSSLKYKSKLNLVTKHRNQRSLIFSRDFSSICIKILTVHIFVVGYILNIQCKRAGGSSFVDLPTKP